MNDIYEVIDLEYIFSENKDEKKQKAWETFTTSGKVEDYLKYKGESYGNDQNKGNSGFGN